ncbi:alpha/beta hydrolase [Microbacterium sp. zg.B48]|uniref:alpha/beta fold hydrolase n=1 Tax=Microbacterium sp. zg.B48 TaxID=2969408 RepID=UPI00214B7AEA|nr:alpha/beta hydrolase [Microbacterium sp. zg.B48]MCR2764253.1 alpha/beta hydrolase [Microbacterium sp. zg.B48]
MNTDEYGQRRSRTRRRKPLMIIAALATTAALALTAPAIASASSADHAPTAVAAGKPAAKPTIVLVHGAWAGASSFDPVTTLLQAQGYTVVNAPNPLRGVEDDISSVVSYVSTVHPEPVILVGHSYGGVVITGAAGRLPNVKALVYIDAYAPDDGESALALTIQNPGSAINPAADFDAVDYPHAPMVEDPPHPDHDAYIKADRFKALFAASLPTVVTRVLAADQSPIALSALGTPFPGVPGWKSIPSWYFVGTDDQVIPPATQRFMAQRAGSKIVEGKSPHLAMYGAPLKVSQLIVSAAKAVG